MLKLFYKTFLISFISGSLLMLDFSFKGSMLNANISSAQAESVQLEGIKDDDMMASLTMTSIGFIASRLYQYKMTTDTMIAAAGGAAFIAGEITAYSDLKDATKDIEKKIFRDKKGNIDQAQIDLLKRLKESYQDAKKTASSKKSLQSTAMSAFMLAAVAAYALKSSEVAVITACKAGISAANAACPDKATSAVTKSLTATLEAWIAGREVPGVSSAAGKSTSTSLGSAATGLQSAVGGAGTTDAATNTASCTASEGTNVLACTLAASCPSAGGLVQVCTAVKTTFEMSESYGMMSFGASIDLPFMKGKNVYVNMSKKSENMFYNLFEKIFLSEAKADLFSPLGIASSAAIKYLMATNAALGTTVDTFLLTPMKRAMVWATLAGLTAASSSATDKQIKTTEENISKIDKILNSMNALEEGVATTNGIGSNNGTSTATTITNPNLVLNHNQPEEVNLGANGPLPCITGSTTANCPSFSNSLNSQADFLSMSDYVQAQARDIANFTDGINGTSRITGTTLGLAQTIAGQQNALRAELAKQQKALQEKLKASGNNIDLARESANLEATLKGIVKKELDSRKTTAAGMLASFGGGHGLETTATDANKNVNDKNANSPKKVTGIGAVVIPAAATPRLEEDDELNAQLKGKNAEELASAEAVGGKASMDEYDIKNDITQDKGLSIFELISNRYQKSGYPRLFKRIK